MFNKKSQKKVIIIVAVFLSLALAGSAFAGFGSMFTKSSDNRNTAAGVTAQEQYDQLLAQIAMYEEALANNPELGLHSYLADLYCQKAYSGMSPDSLSDWGKAADNYQIAYEAALADEAAPKDIEDETQNEDEDQAQDEEPAEIEKRSSGVLYNLAYAFYMAQRYEDAKVAYLRLMEIIPDDVDVCYMYGRVLLDGFADKDGAVEQWEKAKTLTEDEGALSVLNDLIQGAQGVTQETEQETE
ncbi:MAG: hypothetical protein FWF88_13390 [Peptococcaceae bacterium]|nr:hypothetical protein [Peptococcaceae bacterium]